MELIPIEDLERWPVKVIAFCFFPHQSTNSGSMLIRVGNESNSLH